MPDLESVISASISGLPGSEPVSTPPEAVAQDTPAADTPPADAAPAVPAADTPAAVAASADTVSETPEVPAGETVAPEDSLDTVRQELAGKRDNRIPYSRVTKIVENAEKKARAESQTRITELEGKVKHFETPEFGNSLRALELADADPDKFIELLAKSDERYAKILNGRTAAPPPVGSAAPPAGDEVKPDIQLSDGTLGYSAEASDRRTHALLARQAAELRAEFKATLKDYEPVRESYQAHQIREASKARVSARLEQAAKWPGFNESVKEISAYMDSNKGVALHDAYIAVVMPKMRADETAIRQKIADEQRKLAKVSAGVAPGGAAPAAAVPTAADGVDPIEAAIHASIAGLK